MTRPWLPLALIALCGLLAAGPALSQNRPSTRRAEPPAPEKVEPPSPPQEPAAPPYERELLRLSEVVGSLAFLRELCQAEDAAEWPKRMQALLEAEGTTPGRRERMAGAYNRGYRAFALTYRVCTPAAELAVVRYLQEGEKLSRTIAGRFGG